MVNINPRITQNYPIQTKKVVAQNDGEKQDQTQQAETKAVKQPTVPTLQQPTVKVPLETLQINAGITIGSSINISEVKPMAQYRFDSLEDFNAHRDMLKPGDIVTIQLSKKETVVFKVDENGKLVGTTNKEANRDFDKMSGY